MTSLDERRVMFGRFKPPTSDGEKPDDADARLFAAELFDPAEEDLIGGWFHVEEFDAHSDAGLDDTHHRKNVHDLIFAGEPEADTATLTERLAGADKSAADGNIARYAAGFRAGFQI